MRTFHIKIVNYPMAIVTKVYENSIGEVTDVSVRKGSTRETVKRHVAAVIPLFRDPKEGCLSEDCEAPVRASPPVRDHAAVQTPVRRPKRRAAKACEGRMAKWLSGDPT